MSPEFFLTPGVPESKNSQKKFQAERFKKTSNTIKRNLEGYTAKTSIPLEKFEAEHRKFLSKIDFDTMKSVFSDLLSKSSGKSIKPNVIGFKRVFLAYRGSSYDQESNTIILTSMNMLYERDRADGTRERWWKQIDEVYGDRELLQLHALMHEETHAVSRNICIGMGQGSDGYAMYEQSGYTRVSNPESERLGKHKILEFQGKSIIGNKNRRFNDIFEAFNEGVIEKISRQVLIEYLNRTGHYEKKTLTFKKNLLENDDILSYSANVKLVESIIKKLSETAGLPEETVWNTLIRGVMEGETFADKEVKELFKQTFSPDFLKKLSLANDQDGVNKLLEELSV